MGRFKGGNFWVEDEQGDTDIPPELLDSDSQHLAGMKGKILNCKHQWVRFNPLKHHGVTPITEGQRTSLA
eukprot:4988110-Amphidinium_carterae.1